MEALHKGRELLRCAGAGLCMQCAWGGVIVCTQLTHPLLQPDHTGEGFGREMVNKDNNNHS